MSTNAHDFAGTTTRTSGNTVTRRGFLAGSAGAAVAGAAASAGLAGLATASASEASGAGEAAASSVGASSASSSADDGLIASAKLNPQDESWRGVGTDVSEVFKPWKLGPLDLDCRIVKSAAGSATFLNGFTQELIDYYVNFAKGGVQMIWVENFAQHLTGRGGESPVWLLDLDLSPLVEGCKQYGAHLGFQTYLMFADHNGMSVEELQSIQDDIVNAAVFLKEQGFEALEINAAGANLGAMYFSRANNEREDQYGPQSFENRTRWVCEVIQKVKEACGEDFIVQVLMNGIEENDENTGDSASVMSLSEGIEVAKCLEAAGADSLHIRLGALHQHVCQFAGDLYFVEQGLEGSTSYGTQFDFSSHWQGKVDGSHSGAGLTLDVAAAYKQAVSIPVGTVTYLDPAMGPDFFNSALAEGKVDFFLMTRPLTVDTEYVNKLREGRLDEIAPCTRCVHCHIMGNVANATYGYCRVNALTQRVFREGGPASYELPMAETPKRVMVAGGGPAGMEAARIAAMRGHDVTLYEKKGMLGGLLDFAATVKGPHENLVQLKNYLIRQLELTGVNVVLETQVTPELIAAEAPDALIVAVGGDKVACGLAGTPGVTITDIDGFMFVELGKNVTVLGSSARAVDCAAWLQNHGHRVTMITSHPADDVAMGQSNHEKEFILPLLYSRGMRVWSEVYIADIGDGKISVKNTDGVVTEFDCDALVDCDDLIPCPDAITTADVPELYVVGDAKEPFNIALAIRGGNDAGRAV